MNREEFEKLFLILYKKWKKWGTHTTAYGVGWYIWQEQQKIIDELKAELEIQQWISVKKDLPKTEGKRRIKYLCWNHDGQFVTEWREYATGTGFDESFGSVLFWKPLPEPPQEDEG